LFTALEIPHDVAVALSLLRGGLPGARWIDPENYHVTLRFIGDIDQPTAREVTRALERVARRPFDVSVEGVIALGSRKPQSIAAAVAAGRELTELQAEHERIIQRIGLEPERRRFRPHVTLARLRGVREADIAAYLALRGSFRMPPFSVGRFVLLSSRESKGGGPYLVEEAYPLAA
jgi:2'-5' RNA ligase